MGSVREEDVEILEQEETGNNNTNGVDSINNFNNISNVHTEEQEEEAEEMEKTRTKVEKEETKSAGCEGERDEFFDDILISGSPTVALPEGTGTKWKFRYVNVDGLVKIHIWNWQMFFLVFVLIQCDQKQLSQTISLWGA